MLEASPRSVIRKKNTIATVCVVNVTRKSTTVYTLRSPPPTRAGDVENGGPATRKKSESTTRNIGKATELGIDS
jgi:hypothetical protein